MAFTLKNCDPDWVKQVLLPDSGWISREILHGSWSPEETWGIDMAAGHAASAAKRRKTTPTLADLKGTVASSKNDDDDKMRKRAAAEAVGAEILVAFQDDNADAYEVEVKAHPSPFTCQTDAGWRKIVLPPNHRLFWHGKTRASTKGELLFILKPAMNSELTARNVDICEVPYGELEQRFGPSMIQWLTNAMGATVPELIDQALAGVTKRDVVNAAAPVDEVEAPEDETVLMPGWGEWA